MKRQGCDKASPPDRSSWSFQKINSARQKLAISVKNLRSIISAIFRAFLSFTVLTARFQFSDIPNSVGVEIDILNLVGSEGFEYFAVVLPSGKSWLPIHNATAELA